MIKHQNTVTEVIKRDPNVQSYASTVGAGGRNSGGNSGTIFIGLRPLNQRFSADDGIEELRPKLSREPGLRVILQNPPSLNIGGGFGRSTYQVTMQASSNAELIDNAPILERKMRELPLLQDVNSNLQVNTPQINVQIDRKQAAAHSVTIAQIQTALGDAFGSRQVSTIFMPTNEYQVILEAKPEFQSDPTALGRLYIHSSNGRLVPLSAVASFSTSVGPAQVNHYGEMPATTISFNLKPGVSLSQATQQIQQVAKQSLPATITTTFQGDRKSTRLNSSHLGIS